MKSLPLFFVGIFATLALSWTALALVNHNTLGRLEPIPEEVVEEGQSTLGNVVYPRQRSGVAYQGARVYAELGCFNCHTQQVRPADLGADLARKLAPRASVARDYIREARVMLGTVRVGNDLTDLGTRVSDLNELHLQLYNARLVEPRSLMPSYAYLYEERTLKLGAAPSADALKLPDNLDAGLKAKLAGKEVVPTEKAKALVAYLASLKLNYSLPEAVIIEEDI